ncbi:MAG TPA: nucleotidyltransferase domain-containing protein [Nitrospirae bacterium]|nr:nucleotidyltransferase domain-containing protein [Nitrospirota bacterium]
MFSCYSMIMFNIAKTKPEVRKIAEKYRLPLVLLFGSQVSGRTHPQSDVDIAFLSEKRMSLIEIAKMQIVFSQKLKLKNLELVDLKTAAPLLLKQAAEKSVLLYEKEPFLFANFKIYALKCFMEAKKLFDLRKSSLDKFLQNV